MVPKKKTNDLFPLSGMTPALLRLTVAAAMLTPVLSADVYAQAPSTSSNVAKSYRFTGTVVDEENEPLPGATVLVKGKGALGTATDADGKFSLTVNDPKCVLTVTYVGMKPQEVSVSAGKETTIRLENSDNRLSEIVVTGYQTLSKERATGSFDIIDRKQARQGDRQHSLATHGCGSRSLKHSGPLWQPYFRDTRHFKASRSTAHRCSWLTDLPSKADLNQSTPMT